MPCSQIRVAAQAGFSRRRAAHVAPVARVPYFRREAEQGSAMTTFDDRERAFETKYARDQEMQFRVVARRNRLLGHWAARLMGLTEVEAESYAKDVVRADFEEAGDEDVIRKLLGDLTAAGRESDEEKIREALKFKEVDARRQIIEASNI